MKQLIILKATWCLPCAQLNVVIECHKDRLPVDEIKYIDIDEFPDVAREYNARSVPTLILKEDVTILKQTTGVKTPKQLIDFCST